MRALAFERNVIMKVASYEILSHNAQTMGEIASYHRRQRRKGSARKARWWQRQQRAAILRVAAECNRLNLSYIV